MTQRFVARRALRQGTGQNDMLKTDADVLPCEVTACEEGKSKMMSTG